MATELPASLQASLDATKVTYKQLGKSGLRLSVPVLGAMSIGTPDCESPRCHSQKELI